ncbi:MAG: 7-carboxy-7-deazaguanine synthase QueE [Candidatus Omnitrophica bacterium]|nr:7-carboxy-7-deazaguanine synthase QueE [Candidatus Omnitrophota bacterium]
MKAKVSEIFYSIQGEGIYQATPQVFVRFWDCNLDCCFCDTKPESYKEMDLDQVLSSIFSQQGFWDCVAFTGGEPLLQHEFLRDLSRALKQRRKTTYLETNGILVEELKKVIDYLDIIAMDFKLPSSTKISDFWDKHRDFLKEACKKEVFVKAVVTAFTDEEDIVKSAGIIKEVNQNIFLVLQPDFIHEAFLWGKLAEFKEKAEGIIPNVQIIKQLHKHIKVK